MSRLDVLATVSRTVLSPIAATPRARSVFVAIPVLDVFPSFRRFLGCAMQFNQMLGIVEHIRTAAGDTKTLSADQAAYMLNVCVVESARLLTDTAQSFGQFVTDTEGQIPCSAVDAYLESIQRENNFIRLFPGGSPPPAAAGTTPCVTTYLYGPHQRPMQIVFVLSRSVQGMVDIARELGYDFTDEMTRQKMRTLLDQSGLLQVEPPPPPPSNDDE